ncbi:ankyrin [Daldinia caldariorum]|uniref:ankyrin n=1 Tax=Daldinia caldariorum TaxID=326644 RepID=UPI002007E2E1|nr:ankyrin [Daldinia caldariorum]KAI1469610.1 ankyrin [Daldinia caldariorum]
MPSLGDNPIELILNTALYLDDESLSSLSQTCHELHNTLTNTLYARHDENPALLTSVFHSGNTGAVGHLLTAGANPNLVMMSNRSQPPMHLFSLSSNLANGGYSHHDQQDNLVLHEEPVVPSARFYWSLVHAAASMGRNDMIELLLKHGAEIDALSYGYCKCAIPTGQQQFPTGTNDAWPLWTPLHTAICHGHESTARLLLSRGASINVSPKLLNDGRSYVTALHTACQLEDASIARFLISQGHQTDLDVQDHWDYTPMTYAYYANRWDTIELLVNAGASINVPLGYTSLIQHACNSCRFYEALRFTNLGMGTDLAKSFPEDQNDADAVSAMLFACCERMPVKGELFKREEFQEQFRIHIIGALIKAGADLEIRGRIMPATADERHHVGTPLIAACKRNLSKIANILLGAGANIDAKDTLGHTALVTVCAREAQHDPNLAREKLRIVKALLSHTPRRYDDIYQALLHALIFHSEAEIAELLIDHAEPGILDNKDSFKLIEHALRKNSSEMFDLLVRKGIRELTSEELDSIIDKVMPFNAEITFQCLSKLQQAHGPLRNPQRLSHCIRKGYSVWAKLMIEAQMPLNTESIMVEACAAGNFDIVELLLRKGADPNKPSGPDFPLHKAIVEDKLSVIDLLLEYGVNVHSYPGGQEPGALNFAITRGLDRVVERICTHVKYQATQEQRTAYLETAIGTNTAHAQYGRILCSVLRDTNPNVVLPIAEVTPLHLAVARTRRLAIVLLIKNGANIHLCLGPDNCSSQSPKNSAFWGKTPLEWAIDNSPVACLRALIVDPFEAAPYTRSFWPRTSDVPRIRYIRAACRRNEPEAMALLLREIHPITCDEEGNSFLSIFCQTIDEFGPLINPHCPVKVTADNAVRCVVLILYTGADPHKKNNQGVSAMDHLRRMMSYDGPSTFHQEICKEWNDKLFSNDEGVHEKD